MWSLFFASFLLSFSGYLIVAFTNAMNDVHQVA